MNVIYFIFQQTMLFTIPLMIVALGGMFSERSGVVNIALEGIMIMGAFTSILFLNLTGGKMSGQVQLILAIVISMVTGGIFSLTHAYAAINMKADQTISGTALNMFAPAFAIFVARVIQGVQQVQFNNTFRIDSVPVLGKIPVIGPMLFQNAYITTYLGILILIASALVLYKTRFGLRLRACGEHPQAADSVGINVYKMRYAGVLISGALGGLGGLVYITAGVSEWKFENGVAGFGFLALAVMIFGQWKPVNIGLAALLFGLFRALSNVYTGFDALVALKIPSTVYNMLPYIISLVVLVFVSGKSRAPKAEGIPYDKGQR